MRALAIFLALAGCTHVPADLTPLANAKFRGHRYWRVLVQAGGDLKAQGARESRACGALFEHEVKCWRSLDLFPPVNRVTSVAKSVALRERGIDGVLEIERTELTAGTAPTYSTSCVEGNCTSTPSGNEARVSYRIKLIDVASGETAWMADLRDGDEIQLSSMKDAVALLAKDGFVK